MGGVGFTAPGVAVAMLLVVQAQGVQVGGPRAMLKLDGVWASAPGALDDGAQPPQHGWKPLAVPHWDKWLLHGTKCPVRWYRRNVTVPAGWRGKQIVLRFEAVHYKATVFWNGVRVGTKVRAFLPMEFDVTRFVKFGVENDLLVRVEGITAVREKRNGRYIFTEPIAAGYNEAGPTIQGIWWSVYLLARPEVHFADVFVTPSVRSKTLTVRGSILNGGNVPATLFVHGKVFDADNRLVLDLGTQRVRVGPHKTAWFDKTVRWVNPRLWFPYSPVLYKLELTLVGVRGIVDRIVKRFGFREVWVENGHLFLNGVKFFLRRATDSVYWFLNECVRPGDTTDSILARLRDRWRNLRITGVNIVRMHYWPPPLDWVRVADEVGLPLIIEGPFMGPAAKAHPVSDARLWDHFADVWANLAKRYYNAPSVFGYSLENEVFRMQSQRALARERWRAVRDAVRKVDPTRWIWQENGDDVRVDLDEPGLHGISNIHMTAADDGIGVPDNPVALVRRWERGFFNVYCHPCRWPASKPLIIGEWYLNFFGPQLNGARLWETRYNYENCFWRSRVWAAHAYLALMRLKGNLRGVDPWNIDLGKYAGEEGAHLWPIVDVVPRRWITHAYGGETFPFEATLIYDRLRDGVLKITYSLRPARKSLATLLSPMPLCSRTDPGGNAILRESFSLKAKAGETYPLDIRVKLPAVARKTDFMLVITITERRGAKPWVHQFPVRVYPKTKIRSSGLRICCLGERAAEPLRRLGIENLSVRRTPSANDDLVIVGRDDLASLPITTLRSLEDAARNGATVLVLEQSRWRAGWLPVRLSLHRSRTTSIAFIRSFKSVWTQGLDDFDVRFWRPRGTFITHPFRKPDVGNAITLVDSGGPVSLDTAFMLEVRAGRGRFLLCQLPIGQLAGEEPAADEIWRNIARGVDELKRTSEESLGEMGLISRRAMLNWALKDLGVATRELSERNLNVLSERGRALRVILVAGETRLGKQSLAKLNAWVRNGGRLILHAVDAASASAWAKALGLKFAACRLDPKTLAAPTPAQKFPPWRPGPRWRYEQLLADYEQVRLKCHSPLLDGLSPEDLTWSKQLGHVADFRLTDAGGGEMLLEPGVLAVFRCGAGVVVIDQLRWDRALESARGTSLWYVAAQPARRYVSVLLTHLGVEMKEPSLRIAGTMGEEKPLCILPVQEARRLKKPDTPFDRGMPLTRYDKVSADRFNYGWIAWRLKGIPAGWYRLRIRCRIYKPKDPTWGWEMRLQGGSNLPLELVKSLPLTWEDTVVRGAVQTKALRPEVFYGCLQTKSPVFLQEGDVILVGSRWLSFLEQLELLSGRTEKLIPGLSSASALFAAGA